MSGGKLEGRYLELKRLSLSLSLKPDAVPGDSTEAGKKRYYVRATTSTLKFCEESRRGYGRVDCVAVLFGL